MEEKFRFFLQERISPERLQKVVRHIFELRGTRKMMGYLIPLLDEHIIKKSFRIEGLEHLDRALKQGRGVVLMAGHWGNPHLAFCALRVLGYDLTLVKGGAPKDERRRWYRYSETSDDTIFIYDSALAASYKARILDTLRQGRIIEYYADTREGKIKEKALCLGRGMDFSTGMIHLAHQARGSLIPFVHLYRRGTITLIFNPAIDHGWEKEEGEYGRIVADYARLLETYFVSSPEQYMGIYGPTVLAESYRAHGQRALPEEE
jgi:lauroyl/myristoyl acyltransferase